MNAKVAVPALSVVAAVLTACGAGASNTAASPSSAGASTSAAASVSPTASPATHPALDAPDAAAAAALKAAIPQITRLVAITEDNDKNNLIGRPNGYSAAEVVVDGRASCDGGPGVDCGATIEEWPTPQRAKARAEYIQSMQSAAPVLGSEWDTVQGKLVLVSAGH